MLVGDFITPLTRQDRPFDFLLTCRRLPLPHFYRLFPYPVSILVFYYPGFLVSFYYPVLLSSSHTPVSIIVLFTPRSYLHTPSRSVYFPGHSWCIIPTRRIRRWLVAALEALCLLDGVDLVMGGNRCN